jgi:hypothetical protein
MIVPALCERAAADPDSPAKASADTITISLPGSALCHCEG